jgi:hypothetical protein
LLFQAEALDLDRPAFRFRPISEGSPAPWVLPKLWPPAISATVSSSFIAMRAKVSRISRGRRDGIGLPFGPSGLT